MEEEALQGVWQVWEFSKDVILIGVGALLTYVGTRFQWKREEKRREKEFKRQKLEEVYQYLLSGSKGTVKLFAGIRETLLMKNPIFLKDDSETDTTDLIKFFQVIQFYFEDLKESFADLEGHYNILVGLCNQSLELIEKKDSTVWSKKRIEEIEYYHKAFADSVLISVEILSTEMKKYI